MDLFERLRNRIKRVTSCGLQKVDMQNIVNAQTSEPIHSLSTKLSDVIYEYSDGKTFKEFIHSIAWTGNFRDEDRIRLKLNIAIANISIAMVMINIMNLNDERIKKLCGATLEVYMNQVRNLENWGIVAIVDAKFNSDVTYGQMITQSEELVSIQRSTHDGIDKNTSSPYDQILGDIYNLRILKYSKFVQDAFRESLSNPASMGIGKYVGDDVLLNFYGSREAAESDELNLCLLLMIYFMEVQKAVMAAPTSSKKP